jgi:hypothetical protein
VAPPGSALSRSGSSSSGAGERVVHRGPALGVGIPLEHREVDDPQRTPAVLDHAEVLADLEPQRAERVVDDLGLVRAEEHEVAGLRAGALHQAGDGRVRQELEDRRLQALAALRGVVHLDVGEALGAVASDECGVVVDLLARELLAAGRYAQRGHAAVRGRPAGAANTLNSLSRTRSATSTSSSGTRRSGLSDARNDASPRHTSCAATDPAVVRRAPWRTVRAPGLPSGP